MAQVPVLFGTPATLISGWLAFIFLFATAALGYAHYKKLFQFQFKYHIYAAAATLLFALTHATIVFYVYYL